jgi:transcriptional regulator with XRE-family HTH domain
MIYNLKGEIAMQHKTIDENLRTILADNIKKLSERDDYSQEQIATKLGITTRKLLRYKNGESEPPATVLYSMCKLYNVDINSMFMTFEDWLDYVRELL